MRWLAALLLFAGPAWADPPRVKKGAAGQLLERAEMKNGKLDGAYVKYHANCQVAARGKSVEVCLTDSNGFQFTCKAGAPREKSEDPIADALDAFHVEAFSPKVTLTQSDLSSLDGSPVRVGADEVVKKVMEP